MPEPDKWEIFISYSHSDAKWMEAVRRTLEPLIRSGTLSVWADSKLHAGSKWREELSGAIARADAALLLVTPDFLASDFIQGNELPPLLEAARTRGLLVLWVAVAASLYRVTEIEKYQALNEPDRPLQALSKARRQRELVSICEKIHALLANRISSSDHAEADEVSIRFTPLASADLRTMSASTEHILKLLKAELRSHPILTRIDYEYSPRPLHDGYFAVITKQGMDLRIEHVSRCLLSPEKMNLWSRLCEVYLTSYRLPFRTDHNVLFSRPAYERTRRAVADVLENLNRYIYQTKIYADQEVFPNLHRLKREAENAYIAAEQAYATWENGGDPKQLGRVAFEFDTAISTVHKIILEYNCKD